MRRVGEPAAAISGTTQNDGHEIPKYRGVTYERVSTKWRARLYWRGTHTTLGRFQTLELAAKAYDQAAIFVLGESAQTNFCRDRVTDMTLLKRCNFERLDALRKQVQREQLTITGEAGRRAARFAAACYAVQLPVERSQVLATTVEALSAEATLKALLLSAVHCPRAPQTSHRYVLFPSL